MKQSEEYRGGQYGGERADLPPKNLESVTTKQKFLTDGSEDEQNRDKQDRRPTERIVAIWPQSGESERQRRN